VSNKKNHYSIKKKLITTNLIFWYNIYVSARRKSVCASPSCRPQHRLGLQFLGLAQKDSLLLLMDIIYYYFANNFVIKHNYDGMR
jgi:hypothetical protein